jgi:hypothetical protein
MVHNYVPLEGGLRCGEAGVHRLPTAVEIPHIPAGGLECATRPLVRYSGQDVGTFVGLDRISWCDRQSLGKEDEM